MSCWAKVSLGFGRLSARISCVFSIFYRGRPGGNRTRDPKIKSLMIRGRSRWPASAYDRLLDLGDTRAESGWPFALGIAATERRIVFGISGFVPPI